MDKTDDNVDVGIVTDGPENNSQVSTVSSQIEQLTKEDLLKLRSNNSSRINYVDKVGKSEAWKTFQIIQVDEIPVKFAKCKTCHAIYACGSKDGTKNMIHHKCNDVAAKPSKRSAQAVSHKSMDDFVEKKKSVPQPVIDKINDTIVTSLAQDLRPLYSVEGKGFFKMAQTFVDLGADYGKQDIRSIIKHRTTLKNKNMPRLVNNLQQIIKDEMLTTSSFPKLAFTTDMWSDQYKQRKFISLHVHFISDTWKLNSRTLAVEEFDEETATTENIRKIIKTIISRYVEGDELEKAIERSYLITDGGTNLKSVSLLPSSYKLPIIQ